MPTTFIHGHSGSRTFAYVHFHSRGPLTASDIDHRPGRARIPKVARGWRGVHAKGAASRPQPRRNPRPSATARARLTPSLRGPHPQADRARPMACPRIARPATHSFGAAIQPACAGLIALKSGQVSGQW